MDWVELLGFASALLVIVSWIPQVLKSWKTKSTGDLSWDMLVLLLISQVMWLSYGILTGSVPVALTNAVTSVFIAFLVCLKYKYG